MSATPLLGRGFRPVPPIGPRSAARAGAIMGALAWPTLWCFVLLPQPVARLLDLKFRMSAAGMYAFTPMLMVMHGPWRGLRWPLDDLVGTAMNAALWAALAGGASWARTTRRPLMWGIVTLVSAWWVFVAVVAVIKTLRGY